MRYNIICLSCFSALFLFFVFFSLPGLSGLVANYSFKMATSKVEFLQDTVAGILEAETSVIGKTKCLLAKLLKVTFSFSLLVFAS